MGNVRAKFFRDGMFDKVEISIIGDSNTHITKVEPGHLKDFPREWESYRLNEKEVDYGGTALTDVPGIDPNLATAFKLKGIHNAEMLAVISDAAAHGLGMGGLTMRNTAQLLLRVTSDKPQPQKPVADEPKRRGRPPRSVATEVVDLRDDEAPAAPLSVAQMQAADLDLHPVEDN